MCPTEISEPVLGSHIKFERKRRVGIVTLSRPEKGNALTLEMLGNIRDLLVYCQEDSRIRCILLTGDGGSFTTGLDVNSLSAEAGDVVSRIDSLAADITGMLFNGKPMVSAISGKAMGDGVIYTLASDYRVTIRDAYFQMPEVNMGIFPGTGCVVLMTRVIGIPWTKRMLMFGERIPAPTALEINLVDEMVDETEQLLTRGLDRAQSLGKKNPALLGAIKLCANHLADKSYPEAFTYERRALLSFAQKTQEAFIDQFRDEMSPKD